MTYKLNYRFLIKFVIVTGLVLGAIHVCHRRQASRQVEIFHHLAQTAREQNRPDDEIRYLDRYLAVRPADVDARERLGRVRYEVARTPGQALQAFLVLEEALRRDPDRSTLRRHIVEVALDPRLNLVAEAVGHLTSLMKVDEGDGDLEGLMGLCRERERNLPGAEEAYWASIQLKPSRIDSYVRRAAVLRGADSGVAADIVKNAANPTDPRYAKYRRAISTPLSVEADNTIDSLVNSNAGNFRAHLMAAAYRRQFDQPERVTKHVIDAQRLAPDEPEVLLVAAAHERDQARVLAVKDNPDRNQIGAARDRARALLGRGLKLYPALPVMYQASAEVEVDDGKLDEAERLLQRGTGALPESVELWGSLIDVKIRRQDAAGAERALERFRELGGPGPLGDYEAARINVLREEWLEAANNLNRVRDDLVGTPYAVPANLLLARCYEQVGELDRRIEAFSRVLAVTVPTDRSWVEATTGLAEARATLRQTQAALDLYQTLVARAPRAWLAIARIRLGQEMRKEKGSWNFAQVDEALAQAARAIPPDATDLVVLRADLLHLKGDSAGARALLTAFHQKAEEKDVNLWIALAVQDSREGQGDRARAAATLDAARQKLGDSVALRLARARLLVDPTSLDAAARLRALAPADGDGFSKTDQLRLTRGLAEIAAAGGATDVAGDLWAQAATMAPYDLGIHLRRFDRALRANDLSEAGKLLGQIQAVDGTDGTTHRAARALYLLRRAQKDAGDTAARDEAGRLLDAVEAERPGWPRIAVAQGLVADLRGDPERALERYQKAVDQGERDPAVIRRVVELLYDRSRFSDARTFLDQLPEATLKSSQVSRLAAEVSLRTQAPGKAVEYAKTAVNPDSTDYRDQLWLAQVNWAAEGSAGKWEVPARKAVAGAQGDPGPLIALVEMLVASGRRADAESVIAASAEAIAPDRRALTNGRCLLAVGRVEEARTAYKLAVRERPQDVRAARGYADFLMQVGDFDPNTGAAAQWARLKGLSAATPADRDHALMMIAVCARLHQAAGGDYQRVREAVADAGVLEGGLPKAPTDDMSAAKLRSTAVLLSLQADRASKVQAIRHLERLEVVLLQTGQNPTAADRFLRGQLHADLNDVDAARLQLAQAAAADPKNATYLAYYVAFLIRQRRPEMLPDADKWFARLKELQSKQFRTAELESRLAAAHAQPDARKPLAEWEKKPDVPVARLAMIYEELGLFDDAARMYQALSERSRRPEGLLPFATFLGRRQRTAEAFQRCEEARKQNCPPAALTAAGVLVLYTARNPSPADISRVLDWIQEALRRADAQPAVTATVLNHQAAVFNLQARYDEAISVYERLLTLNPRDAVAMNNLGYLLATHRRDFGRAFGWLDKAKAVAGPVAELLDTEALIHLARAKVDAAARKQSVDAALALLGDVEVQAPSATAYFHLALARLAAGNEAEARLAWTEAQNRKLAVADLHPLERVDQEELRSRFGG